MNAIDLAVAQLKLDEGFRAQEYVDIKGHTSIGYGFNIEAGISQYAATALLMAQVREISNQLQGYKWMTGLDDARASVIAQMAFNLGLTGMLHFPAMLAAVSQKNWQVAHDQLLDSDAARQLPARYMKMAQILLSGDAVMP